MSILIKGMEMPQNCYDCIFGHNCPQYEALLWNDILKPRKAECPLIFVPEHGRLIDADALKDKMLEYFGDSTRLCEEIRAFFCIAPTIIPIDNDGET